MSMPVCDRCGHLPTDHDRVTKYTDKACGKRNKNAARLHKEVREGTVHELAGALIICICDGLFVRDLPATFIDREAT
jgi:hypothetical protein